MNVRKLRALAPHLRPVAEGAGAYLNSPEAWVELSPEAKHHFGALLEIASQLLGALGEKPRPTPPSPLTPPPPGDIERFWAKVARPPTSDERRGLAAPHWYSEHGRSASRPVVARWRGRKNVQAVRVAYELETGEALPPRVKLKNLCGDLSCVNARDHYRVSRRYNRQRIAETAESVTAGRQFCAYGDELRPGQRPGDCAACHTRRRAEHTRNFQGSGANGVILVDTAGTLE